MCVCVCVRNVLPFVGFEWNVRFRTSERSVGKQRAEHAFHHAAFVGAVKPGAGLSCRWNVGLERRCAGSS